MKHTTLKDTPWISGHGIHNGIESKIRFLSAVAGTGIVFLKNSIQIPAKVEFYSASQLCTSIERDGEKISTVEHLMAALYGAGITDVVIEVVQSVDTLMLHASPN